MNKLAYLEYAEELQIMFRKFHIGYRLKGVKRYSPKRDKKMQRVFNIFLEDEEYEYCKAMIDMWRIHKAFYYDDIQSKDFQYLTPLDGQILIESAVHNDREERLESNFEKILKNAKRPTFEDIEPDMDTLLDFLGLPETTKKMAVLAVEDYFRSGWITVEERNDLMDDIDEAYRD